MNTIEGKVVRVIDGDTLWVRIRVRSQSSAPPANTPQGQAATRSMRRKWRPGQRIDLDPRAADIYGRLVARL